MEQTSFNFMASVIICSDFGAQENKSLTVSIASPSMCHEVMGPDVMIFILRMLNFFFQARKRNLLDGKREGDWPLRRRMLSFKPAFTLIKRLLMKVKEKSEKAGLKLNIQKTTITESSPITSWQKMGKQSKQ